MAPDMDSMPELLQAMRRHLDRGIDHHHAGVSFDEHTVRLWKRSPGGERVPRATFAWSSVRRICFKDSGPFASDLLYVFTRNPDSALVVPLEVDGGGEFWRQLPARGLFPSWLHERATLSTDGGFYCWPPR
jgi:hypothetical protein